MALFPRGGSHIASSLASSGAIAAPWVQRLARVGYVARGVVYIVVGGLAMQAAITSVRRPEDSSGALLAILRQPFGRALLAVLAAGLIAWVLWRLFQAVRDPERKGTDARGLGKRASYLVSALLYGGLALEAVRLSMGSPRSGGSGEASADHWTGVVMAQPAGRWIIAALGAGVALFALYELYRSYTADFRRKLNLERLGADGRKRIVLIGRLGMAARGIVFGIIGWFLVKASYQYDPQEAQGFATSLRTVQEQGYGRYLLAAVAVGLFAYGLFELAEARYRVIRTS